ncbi:MAG: histidine phosphatase family protein [Myxococcota bacterium]
MSILLIRHGETAGNRDRVVQRPDVPLSEQGLAQAERLAERLAGEPIGLVLSSDLARAEMTARAIERRAGAPLELDPRLQERNFGDLRGTPYSELSVDLFAPGYAPPAGESWERFHARVDRAWSFVAERASRVEGLTAVVTHGLVCHSLCVRHLRLPPGAVAEAGPDGPLMRFGNTALTVIEKRAPWRVSTLACTAHLETGTETGTATGAPGGAGKGAAPV